MTTSDVATVPGPPDPGPSGLPNGSHHHVDIDSPPDAQLRLPADSAYLAVLRSATAGLAARINFTLDDIEDLRIAVDEACAILLPQAAPASQLDCTFWLGGATMTVAVGATCTEPKKPSEQGFAWRVLTALTTHARSEVTDDRLVLTLSRSAGQHP
jgi:serine/threonine-protein kinase RsbW